MASGPCGVPFREAFSCFHYSEADPKGSDCYQQFRSMQDCMTSYPELYPSKDDDEEEADNENKLNNEETKTDSLESLTVANTDKKTEKESS